LCNVFTFHELYSPLEKTNEIAMQCRNADIGCTDCKKILGAGIQNGMNLIHERQSYYRNHLQEVRDIIADGDIRARAVAKKTMDEVRAAMKISYGL
jgi:tryptophanyl-tRNA synthetase